jgi:hypothetical protein
VNSRLFLSGNAARIFQQCSTRSNRLGLAFAPELLISRSWVVAFGWKISLPSVGTTEQPCQGGKMAHCRLRGDYCVCSPILILGVTEIYFFCLVSKLFCAILNLLWRRQVALIYNRTVPVTWGLPGQSSESKIRKSCRFMRAYPAKFLGCYISVQWKMHLGW